MMYSHGPVQGGEKWKKERKDIRLESPNHMPFIFILILTMSGMIVRMMFNLTMSFSSLRMMRGIMGWDMGGVIFVYRDTVFF